MSIDSAVFLVSLAGILVIVGYRLYRNMRSFRGAGPRMSPRLRIALAFVILALFGLFIGSLVLR